MGKTIKNLRGVAKKFLKGDFKGAFKKGDPLLGEKGFLSKSKKGPSAPEEAVPEDTSAEDEANRQAAVVAEAQLAELRNRRRRRRPGVATSTSGLVSGVGAERGLVGL